MRGNVRAGWLLFEALSHAIRPLALRVLLLDRRSARATVFNCVYKLVEVLDSSVEAAQLSVVCADDAVRSARRL